MPHMLIGPRRVVSRSHLRRLAVFSVRRLLVSILGLVFAYQPFPFATEGNHFLGFVRLPPQVILGREAGPKNQSYHRQYTPPTLPLSCQPRPGKVVSDWNNGTLGRLGVWQYDNRRSSEHLSSLFIANPSIVNLEKWRFSYQISILLKVIPFAGNDKLYVRNFLCHYGAASIR